MTSKVRTYNPKFQFFHSKGKYPQNLTFGFENEVAFKYWNYHCKMGNKKLNESFDLFMNSNDHLYSKVEPSNNGIEINSHPFDYNWFSKNNGFVHGFEALNSISPKDFRITNSCGFHIHMSRNFFTECHLAKMIKFFYSKQHTNFLKSISKRTTQSFNHWAKNKLGFYRAEEYSYKDIARWTPYKFDSWMSNKASILNLGLKNTVEIRMFKATLNPELFLAYMEFAVGVVLFTQKYSMKDINVENFVDFVREKKYSNLVQLIRNPDKMPVVKGKI